MQQSPISRLSWTTPGGEPSLPKHLPAKHSARPREKINNGARTIESIDCRNRFVARVALFVCGRAAYTGARRLWRTPTRYRRRDTWPVGVDYSHVECCGECATRVLDSRSAVSLRRFGARHCARNLS